MSDQAARPDWADVEQRLEKQYVSFFQEVMGMPQEAAAQIFKAIVDEQKEAAHREGTDRFPDRFGEILLEKERVDETVRDAFAPKRADGVTDEDIVLWWNMHDLERRMVCKVDDMNRVIQFEILVRTENVEEAEAAQLVAKRFPIYGDRDHRVFGTEQDAPLPFELKWRINRYLQKRAEESAETFSREIDGASSLNALLRKAVSSGEL